MSAAAQAQALIAAPMGILAGWARQGVESFVAAQKILLDLTAQQNALAIGMIRERVRLPKFHPGNTIARVADQSVANITAAGKILLDLAAGETALVVDGVKEGIPLPPAAGAVADLIRARVTSLIEMQKQVLEVAAEQTHAVAESYVEGSGLMAGASVAELARRGLEQFVHTEKKFLDLVADEVTTVTEGGKDGRKTPRNRTKVLTQLARQGVDEFLEAQKKLLDLAIDQLASSGKAAPETAEAEEEEARTSLAELTQKSVQNFVAAQKSLMDLAVKPVVARAPAGAPRKAARRPRRKK